MKETKSDRFKRLATQRTRSVINKLRVLGNCANRNAYEYSAEDVRKIFHAIDEQLREVRSRFKNPEEKEFKL